MRRYDFSAGNSEDTITNISLLELSHYAEMYGFDSEEFELCTDLMPGGSMIVEGTLITRTDNPST